jgi:hypothetical protein
MKKCKNCKVNNARYICLGCNREFCTYCMKEDEFLCSQCKYNNKQQQGNEFKLKTNNHHRITNIINIIIASSILFLGIILVLTSYPSIVNMINSNSNDGIISEEKENNNINGYIYIFPFPFAIPIEFNTSFIVPLILIFIIIISIIMFIIILKSIKIS